MSKQKLSLEEQIAKYTEKAQALKRKKAEEERRQRKANLDKIGQALDKLDFDVANISFLAGCVSYALEATKNTPGLEEKLKESGEKIITQPRREATTSSDSSGSGQPD